MSTIKVAKTYCSDYLELEINSFLRKNPQYEYVQTLPAVDRRGDAILMSVYKLINEPKEDNL